MQTANETRIFVSSVYAELVAYRRAALDAVWRCDYYPIGMEREDYAMPFSTSESSRRMVDQAAVYVGIFAHRYGVVTVEELQRAQERGIPVLVFLAAVPLDERDREPDPERARQLEALKDGLRQRYVVATFATPEELGAKVVRSLVALREDGVLPPPSHADNLHGRASGIIPQPPAPYYAHPYVLGGAGFVGRRTELAQLDAWAGGDDPLLLVEAIGGAGKSALAWDWVRTRLDAVVPHRAGTMWWSFYESNATMGSFLARALAYLAERPEEDCARLARYEQEEQLLALLARRPVVVVLDGLERLLAAYHRLDASQLADAEIGDAGAAGGAAEGRPRACVDPRDGAFLRALTRCAASKVLITTRLIPADLQDRAGQLVQGVAHLALAGLSADDAIALMARAGVRGTHELMRPFLAQFGDHALLVQVLAGRIAAYRPAPGDFDAWYRAEGQHLQLDPRDLTARQASVLDAALADLDPAIFRFLCQLAAFRYPVDYAALVALNPFTATLQGEAAPPSRPPVPGEVQARDDAEAALARLHRALTELEERGLVQWDREHNRYDLHPVVRAYAYARLEDKPATFARMRDYFEALPAERREQVQDVADLRRTLEIYHALVESGQLDEAFRLYRSRLGILLLYDLGAYTTVVELLTPLFPRGFAEPPALTSVRDQSYLANDLAIAFEHLDEFVQARALFGVGIRLKVQTRDATNLAGGIDNLGLSFMHERRLAAAERALLLSRDLAAAIPNQRNLDIAQQNLLGLYGSTGAWAAGESAYMAVLGSPDHLTRSQPFVPIYAAQLRFGQGEDPTALIEQALASARTDRFPRAEREALRLQGEVALARGDLILAEEAWQAAYAIAQRQAQRLESYLANLARLRARQGNAALARELIVEALASGRRGVELAAAEVYVALGDADQAGRHALPAYREAWADGPPYAFALELWRAQAVFAALALPEPSLPPFDPATVPPVPYEAEIHAYIAELQRKRDGGERDPDAFDESRLGPTISRLDPPRDAPDVRDPDAFDESRLGPTIRRRDPPRETSMAADVAEGSAEDPADMATDAGDQGSAPVPARRRRWWAPWGRGKA